MKQNIKNSVLLLLMLAASGLAIALKPTERLAEISAKVDLERMVPKQFGEWELDEKIVYQQVNPETASALKKIYTQVLTRTYINRDGYRMMLSVPYGADQSDGLAAHDPEGCYPAQGFQVLSKSKDILSLGIGKLPIRRMEAVSGNRHEVLSYWFTVGAYAFNNDWDRKKAQFHYAFHGQIADGLLVRVSSIDEDTDRAYKIQQRFIDQLLNTLTAEDRVRIAGIAK